MDTLASHLVIPSFRGHLHGYTPFAMVDVMDRPFVRLDRKVPDWRALAMGAATGREA